MKISIDIDCTPQEARTFFGLPDVAPMQEAMMDAVRGRLEEALAASNPETLLKTWLPMGTEGFERMQKAFWDAASGMSPGGRK